MDPETTVDIARILMARPLDPIALQAETVKWLMLGDAAAEEALARARRAIRFDGSLLHWDFNQRMLRSLEGLLSTPAEYRAIAGADIARDTGLTRLITRRDLRKERGRGHAKR